MDSTGDDLVDAVSARLRLVGVTLHSFRWLDGPGDSGAAAIATLARGNHRQDYLLNLTASMTLNHVSHLRLRSSHIPVLVMGERIVERSAASLRDLNIDYIDSLGNAHIEFGDVYIDVRGRTPKNTDPTESSSRPIRWTHTPTTARVAKNLFSARRAQVSFALLAWPDLATAPVREVAAAAGVSTGQAYDALGMLDAADLIHRGDSLHPYQRDTLLGMWGKEYSRGLRRKLTLASYHTDDPGRPVVNPHVEQQIYLSGESATGVDIHTATTLTLYATSPDLEVALANRWRRPGPSQVPNVLVLEKFWDEPRGGDAIFSDTDLGLDGISNAPWPLVYADLLASHDPRLAEVAETWRRRVAGPDGH